MSADLFCDDCGVRNDMHDMSEDDPCEAAEAEASRIERVERAFWGVVR